jgi:ABC-type multidrug transport system permease subunit
VYLASVGSSVAANVAPNEINTLTAEIAKQQELLNRREAELNEREIKARSFGSEEGTDYSIYIISAILFIIIVLLIVNYVLDFTRVRRYRYENTMG